MAFQGSLAELHLPDIIQLVSVSGKTGVFHLVDGVHRGQIWLFEGRIVHAEAEDLSGEEAVYSLAIWRSGEFRFEPNTTAPRQTIQKSNTGLLMEAARRLDEWRVLQKKIPSVDLVPEFVLLDNREGQINLNTMEWLLLSKIDGSRSLKQVASASGMSVFDTAKLLYGLVATNLIRLKDASGTAHGTHTPAGGSAAAHSTAASGPVPVARAAAPPAAQRPATVRPGTGPIGTTTTPRPAAAPAAPATGSDPLLARLAHLREECITLLGPVGETVVQKHYLRARAEIERGTGPQAIDEAVQQISRAAGILKGAPTAEAILKLLGA